MLLSLIIGTNLICFDNDKAWFIIIGFFSIVSQIIPFLNKIKSDKKKERIT